jgi:tetratricopeptide (TPR) repeat protein
MPKISGLSTFSARPRGGLRVAGLVIAGLLASSQPVVAQTTAAPGTGLDCFSEDMGRVVQGCTDLLAQGGLSDGEKATAHSRRALALSLRGRYEESIQDYDRSLELQPNAAVPLNNRAWAYFKWGRPGDGLADVEKSLRLSPFSPHALDTRAHIRQWLGQPGGALQDYEMAMRFGGSRMIRMYQCGLSEAGLYKGELNGEWNEDVSAALAQCVKSTRCDPLPADEQCKPGTS